MQAFSLGEASRDLFSFLFQYLSINLSISFASFWSVIWALICVLAIDECLLIICKEMLPIKDNHIAVGNTRIIGEEKEVASSLQLHPIRLKGQALQLIQRCPIQCTRLFVLPSFDRTAPKGRFGFAYYLVAIP